MENGYDKTRFKGTMIDQFDCPICLNIVKYPYECDGCGDIYCKQCIEDWKKKSEYKLFVFKLTS